MASWASGGKEGEAGLPKFSSREANRKGQTALNIASNQKLAKEFLNKRLTKAQRNAQGRKIRSLQESPQRLEAVIGGTFEEGAETKGRAGAKRAYVPRVGGCVTLGAEADLREEGVDGVLEARRAVQLALAKVADAVSETVVWKVRIRSQKGASGPPWRTAGDSQDSGHTKNGAPQLFGSVARFLPAWRGRRRSMSERYKSSIRRGSIPWLPLPLPSP